MIKKILTIGSLFSLLMVLGWSNAKATSDFANVQGKAVVGAATSSTTVSFDTDVTAGDLVVVSIGQKGTQTLPTAPTDNQSNSYSSKGGYACGILGSAAQRSLQTWYTFASSTGTLTVTVQSPNNAFEVVMREFSGSFNTTDPVDVTNSSTPVIDARCQAAVTTLYSSSSNLLSYTGDGLAYSVVMSPNSTTLASTGFGAYDGMGAFVLDTGLSYSGGAFANASLKGSIGDAYVLSVPTNNPAFGRFSASTSIESLGQTIMFRHN